MSDSTARRSLWLAFLRHGSAEAGGYPLSDSDRRLTDDGRREVQETAALARRAGYVPIAAYTSPFPRAHETASIFLDGLSCPVVLVEDERIVPEADADAAVAWVRGLVEIHAAKFPSGQSPVAKSVPRLTGDPGAHPVLLFVAHEPILSSIASRLLGRRRRAFERSELVVLSRDSGPWQERTSSQEEPAPTR